MTTIISLITTPMQAPTQTVCAHNIIFDHIFYPHLKYSIFTSTASQFFLCTAETPWLDGKNVVFGKVVSGMDVVAAIEQVGSESGRTRVPLLISDSGQLR